MCGRQIIRHRGAVMFHITWFKKKRFRKFNVVIYVENYGAIQVLSVLLIFCTSGVFGSYQLSWQGGGIAPWPSLRAVALICLCLCLGFLYQVTDFLQLINHTCMLLLISFLLPLGFSFSTMLLLTYHIFAHAKLFSATMLAFFLLCLRGTFTEAKGHKCQPQEGYYESKITSWLLSIHSLGPANG